MGSAREGRVPAADGRDPALGLFPVLLAAQGGQVEQDVRGADVFGAAGEGRIGVEDVLAVAQEAAVAGHLGGMAVAEELRLGR